MKILSKRWQISFFSILFILILAACQADDNNSATNDTSENETNNINESDNETNNVNDENETNESDSESITLKIGNELSEDDQEALKEEFPHIIFEFDEVSAHEDDIEDEITQDKIPDIFYISGGDQIPNLDAYELSYDLTELIEESDFDLSTIADEQIDIVRKWSGGEIKYFPYVKRWDVLYYNKDIFDKFGVDYPEDGMTWNEVEALAREVNGEIDGNEYRGIDISSTGAMIKQLEVNHVDPETDESLYASDERFAKYLRMIEKIATIPGVVPDDEERGSNEFLDEQTVAMVPLYDIHIWLSDIEAETGLSWDMVSYPVFEDEEEQGIVTNASGLTISRTSEHKEEAFEVLEYLLSKESQMMRSKAGSATVLKDTEVQEAFSTEVEGLEDKNMQAVFYLDELSGPEERSEYEEDGEIIDGLEFVRSGQDINTYLREISEEANAAIEDAKGSD